MRDIDAIEKENVRRAGIGVFTMRDIDERGMRTVMEEALRLAGRGTAGYHVSLDMDWIDPAEGLFVFTGLASAFVALLSGFIMIRESIQNSRGSD